MANYKLTPEIEMIFITPRELHCFTCAPGDSGRVGWQVASESGFLIPAIDAADHVSAYIFGNILVISKIDDYVRPGANRIRRIRCVNLENGQHQEALLASPSKTVL